MYAMNLSAASKSSVPTVFTASPYVQTATYLQPLKKSKHEEADSTSSTATTVNTSTSSDERFRSIQKAPSAAFNRWGLREDQVTSVADEDIANYRTLSLHM